SPAGTRRRRRMVARAPGTSGSGGSAGRDPARPQDARAARQPRRHPQADGGGAQRVERVSERARARQARQAHLDPAAAHHPLFQRHLGRSRGAAAPRRNERPQGDDRHRRLERGGHRAGQPSGAGHRPALGRRPGGNEGRTDQAGKVDRARPQCYPPVGDGGFKMAFDLRGKPLPQRWMLGAILLNFVSQFLLYLNDGSIAGLYDMTDPQYYTQMVVYAFAQVGTGWQLHPQAYILLPILAFLFLREDFVQRPWFIRFGYWIGVAMLFACCLPGAPFRQALGAALGFIAIFIGVWAAVLHGRAVKAAKPPATG